MSKKSAKSKGYRKTVQKKPYLSKKDIIALISVIALILVGILLFNLLYDDGFIGAKEIKEGDVVAFANPKAKTRFLKMADANELEGFTMEPSGETNTAVSYLYHPEDKDSKVELFMLSASNREASALADEVLNNSEADAHTQKFTEKVQGYDAYVFAYTYDYYDESKEAAAEDDSAENGTADVVESSVDETEERPADDVQSGEESKKPSNTFCQNITMYIAFDADHTMVARVYLTDDNPDFYMPEDQIVDYIMPYTSAFSMVQPEVKETAKTEEAA